LSIAHETVDQFERYFLVQVDQASPDVRNSSPESIVEHKWWSRDDLALCEETIYPEQLRESLERILDGSHS